MIVSIIRWVICIIYGGLTLFACANSFYNKISHPWVNIIMGLSAISLILINIKRIRNKIAALIIILIGIQFCAIMNGYYSGNINVIHHVIRLIVHICIVILFLVSMKKTAHT